MSTLLYPIPRKVVVIANPGAAVMPLLCYAVPDVRMDDGVSSQDLLNWLLHENTAPSKHDSASSEEGTSPGKEESYTGISVSLQSAFEAVKSQWEDDCRVILNTD